MSVNAPSAGKIVELLAKEEDTVTVGADLFRIEAGSEGGESKPAESKPAEAPKEEAPKKEETPAKQEEAPKPKETAAAPPPPPKEEKKVEQKKEQKPATPAPEKRVAGSRNETRVRPSSTLVSTYLLSKK